MFAASVVPGIQHPRVIVPNFVPIPSRVNSPVHILRLAEALHDHPDHNFVNYLLHGFSFGFDIGFRGSRAVVLVPI